jgi:hypothetical protein
MSAIACDTQPGNQGEEVAEGQHRPDQRADRDLRQQRVRDASVIEDMPDPARERRQQPHRVGLARFEVRDQGGGKGDEGLTRCRCVGGGNARGQVGSLGGDEVGGSKHAIGEVTASGPF